MMLATKLLPGDIVTIRLICTGLLMAVFLSGLPGHANAQERIKIKGIEIPVSKFKAKRGGKPSAPTYYGYHFKPRTGKPAPYLIYIPSSTSEVYARNHWRVRKARRFAGYGYGVIVIDINRGVTGTKEYNGLVGAPPRSIGALSFIKYIKDNYPELSNGRFGAWGASKGGETTIEINKVENRDGAFFFRNVETWFDALVAYYPICGDNNLAAPQLVLIGEADEWTSASNCESWEKYGNTTNLTVHYFPGAHHVFDGPFAKGGKIVRGFKVEYNKQADEKAHQLTRSFFDEHLKFDSLGYAQAQELLNKSGFDAGVVDGQFGTSSLTALKAFQENAGLEATGMLDFNTQQKLREAGEE